MFPDFETKKFLRVSVLTKTARAGERGEVDAKV